MGKTAHVGYGSFGRLKPLEFTWANLSLRVIPDGVDAREVRADGMARFGCHCGGSHGRVYKGVSALECAGLSALRRCPVLRVRASVRAHRVDLSSGDDVCAEETASAFDSVAGGSTSVLESVSASLACSLSKVGGAG